MATCSAEYYSGTWTLAEKDIQCWELSELFCGSLGYKNDETDIDEGLVCEISEGSKDSIGIVWVLF